MLEQDTKMREFILFSSQTFPMIEKIPFQKRSIPLYRVYKKNLKNLKLLLTSHSGQRNEIFDQYRLFGYLKCKINQKIVNLNFHNPGGGCVYSTVKKRRQWLEHSVSGFALLFIISNNFPNCKPFKTPRKRTFCKKN